MKVILLVFASTISLASTYAQATTFVYTGGSQQFTAIGAGTYTIDAYGAQGGNEAMPGGDGTGVGGTFNLTIGEVLDIGIGAAGVSYSQDPIDGGGGGGGGTYVLHTGTPLLVAGGGGGGGFSTSGGAGQQGTSGSNGYGPNAGAGGQNGADGGSGGNYGGHGLANGAGGGASYYGGGGGGGFSGGGGGNNCCGGGGGGSFFGGVGPQVDLGNHAGNGLVTIDLLAVGSVPEPLSWAMMLSGFGLIGWLRRQQMKRGFAPAKLVTS